MTSSEKGRFSKKTFQKKASSEQVAFLLQQKATSEQRLVRKRSLPKRASSEKDFCYGVATINRFLKIIGLFCRILSLS